jgi:hypothetical protein
MEIWRGGGGIIGSLVDGMQKGKVFRDVKKPIQKPR